MCCKKPKRIEEEKFPFLLKYRAILCDLLPPYAFALIISIPDNRRTRYRKVPSYSTLLPLNIAYYKYAMKAHGDI